ncbi:MAG: hypothetical protein D3915_12660 [Candidatus Electrothrix sp. AU1_5]|nr:hypothetical protein [Candidatus Electrothrix gigas]
MGTLTEQPRHLRTSITENIDGDIATMVDLAKKHGISVSDVIAVADMLERRRFNFLYLDNGDFFDMHMNRIAEIGESLQRIADALEELSRRKTE